MDFVIEIESKWTEKIEAERFQRKESWERAREEKRRNI